MPASNKTSLGTILPLGQQSYPVLIGKLKNEDSIVVQANERYVKIPKEYLRETILAMISCLPGGLHDKDIPTK